MAFLSALYVEKMVMRDIEINIDRITALYCRLTWEVCLCMSTKLKYMVKKKLKMP